VKVETVFFDAGGVLVHPSWNIFADLIGEHGFDADPARLADAELRCAREMDDGALIARTDDKGRVGVFFRRTAELAGIDVGAAGWEAAMDAVLAWHRSHNLWGNVPDDVLPTLDALLSRGKRLLVLSNAGGTVRAKLARVGLSSRFLHILDSHEEGVEKPDPRFFRIGLARSGALPETTVHIGDFFHVDVIGARGAGLRAVLLDRAGLHPDRDVPRIRRLTELAPLLDAWEGQPRS
jgi:HAD superfamily hydrolase (TIGR01509 family)